jgi:hypothetical protein
MGAYLIKSALEMTAHGAETDIKLCGNLASGLRHLFREALAEMPHRPQTDRSQPMD